MGIDGPKGFSCWSFDYDNDGWLDIFAVYYDRTDRRCAPRHARGCRVERTGNRLYRNLQGKGFQDVSVAAGLEPFFASMGSNFADFDNDGFLDMYQATGGLSYGFLVPNRMLRNVEGKRFADISSSSRTGHLQKGHGVACGDWDRDGDVDLFVEMGGGRQRRQVSQPALPEPRSGQPLADRQARRQEDQPRRPSGRGSRSSRPARSR